MCSPSPTPGVHALRVRSRWLRDHGLACCVVQLRPAPLDRIRADDSRPRAVETVRHLLAEGALARLSPGSAPAAVILPELAFGSGDLPGLDALVRGHERPLLLLAGFGFTSGHHLVERVGTSASGIEVRPGWPSPWQPLPDARYNGGWLWVHRPGEPTRRFVFLKNFLQQRDEARASFRILEGEHVLRVDFDDFTLFPLICADLVCTHDQAPRRRIHDSLCHRPAPRDQVALAGLLREDRPHSPAWTEAITRWTAVGPASVAPRLLLVNPATDRLPSSPREDRWRNLTGVYVHARELPSPDAPLATARYVSEGPAAGLVLRTTEAAVWAGRIAWDLGATRQLDLWTRPAFAPLLESGAVGPPESAPPLPFELSRFARRRAWAEHRNQLQELRDLTRKLLAEAATCLGEPDPGALRRWLGRTLWGTGPEPAESPPLHADTLDREPRAASLTAGLECLTLLHGSGRVPVDADPEGPGHLRAGGGRGTAVLVWVHGELRSSTMRRRVQAWLDRSERPERLLVFARGRGTVHRFDSTGSITEPRDETPPFQSPRLRRQARIRSLDAIEDFTDPHSPHSLADRLAGSAGLLPPPRSPEGSHG